MEVRATAEFEALNPTRAFLVGDTHGNSRFVDASCRRARDLDCPVVLQVGDFGLWPGREGRAYVESVSASAIRYGIELCWIDGNHDDHGQIRRWSKIAPTRVADRVTYLPRGLRWTWQGVAFGALGGAFSVDWRGRVPEQSWWPDEVLSDADVERLGEAGLDVLICHDAPGEMPMRSRWILRPADQAVADECRRRIQDAVDVTQPRLIVHGHWHHRHVRRPLRYIDQTHTAADPSGAVHWAEVDVEGLGADVSDPQSQAWAILHLPSLEVTPL